MIDLEPYDYKLPKELIAQIPREPRESSRLMVLGDKDEVRHDVFHNISNYMEKDDLVVVNNTKVLPARLVGTKSTGGKIELLVFERTSPRIAKALVKGKVKAPEQLEFNDCKGVVIEKIGGLVTVEFDLDVDRILTKNGIMPLPPYIKTGLQDGERYQTVYAENEGSIAAPTAGLHFSPEILKQLKQKGIDIATVTLHINIGTFLPVEKSMNVPEYFKVERKTADTINKAVDSDSKVFVVGTSTYKCLESACNENGRIMPGEGRSSQFIYPPYEFKFNAHAFLTNFHLPKSSVLLLTCTYAGRERLLRAYEEAINQSYRFYSFGDSMLIFRGGSDV